MSSGRKEDAAMINTYIATYGKRLYGLCRTLCGSSFEADDLYQDTWLQVVRHMDKYDRSRPFEPWLTRICVNLYRNRLRRWSRSPIQQQFASNEAKEQLMAGVAAPQKEDYSDLYAAIDRLPEKLRLTVILFYFQEMDLAAVGQTLGVPVGTVKSRLNRARNQLKEVLQDEL